MILRLSDFVNLAQHAGQHAVLTAKSRACCVLTARVRNYAQTHAAQHNGHTTRYYGYSLFLRHFAPWGLGVSRAGSTLTGGGVCGLVKPVHDFLCSHPRLVSVAQTHVIPENSNAA